MKHFFLIVACSIATIAVMTGCSTKFNIAAPYKNITVVYGLLDEGDTAHYIRIQKAFLSQTLSALNMEKVSDSSFYPASQLNVVMREIDPSNNGSIVNTINLTRVDLNQEGYQKDSGAFFTTPNYAYKFTNKLDPSHTYRLVITNTATGDVDSAETTIIDESAQNFACGYLDITGYALSFYHYNGAFAVTGKVPSTVAYIQGVLRVKWVEKNSLTNTVTKKYADWQFADLAPASNGGGGNTNSFNLQTNTAQFYSFLQGAMPQTQYVTRLMDSAELFLYTANSDFYTYMQVTQTLGTGLTGMDIEPTYTNLKCNSGNNVIGIYGGRGMRSGFLIYDQATIDSLMVSPLLTSQNIVGSTY